MSTHFDAYCEMCDEWGPQVRRQAGGVVLLPASWSGPQDELRERTQSEWIAFLIDHEYHGGSQGCGIQLLREGGRP